MRTLSRALQISWFVQYREILNPSYTRSMVEIATKLSSNLHVIVMTHTNSTISTLVRFQPRPNDDPLGPCHLFESEMSSIPWLNTPSFFLNSCSSSPVTTFSPVQSRFIQLILRESPIQLKESCRRFTVSGSEYYQRISWFVGAFKGCYLFVPGRCVQIEISAIFKLFLKAAGSPRDTTILDNVMRICGRVSMLNPHLSFVKFRNKNCALRQLI